jgi:hypothetical protein
VWDAATAIGHPYGTVVHLFVLTGQRPGEIANLRWSWINQVERTISLPEWVCKNSREQPRALLAGDAGRDRDEVGAVLARLDPRRLRRGSFCYAVKLLSESVANFFGLSLECWVLISQPLFYPGRRTDI